MKIAVIGANGQLGADISDAFDQRGEDVVRLTHEQIEVANLDSVVRALWAIRPNLVVNTAAMHHVEQCEADPEKAFAVNATGARNVAMVCQDLNATLVHISTDYVFDGRKRTPYGETDQPAPLNVYGHSKLAGEVEIQNLSERYIILRVSGLYGTHRCRAKGHNFVELMLKLACERGVVHVVDDEVLTPTWTAEVARQIVALSRADPYGLFHATAEGACSWYEFAREIFLRTGTPVDLQRAQPGQFPMKVPRPRYSVLENKRLKQAGLNMFRPWQEGLIHYLKTGHRYEPTTVQHRYSFAQ
jgi:dTDP-4-dehydrorhamnose reductase